MSKADDNFWRQFASLLVGLSIFGVVVAFIARSIAGDSHLAQVNDPAAVAARIAPAGQVRIGDPTQTVAAAPSPAAASPAAAPGGGGQSIYESVCSACHASGVANAPKLDDKAAWKPRLALGLDALVSSVVTGKGAMPPKGGMPSLDEAQIRSAVKFMLVEMGEAMGESASPAPSPTAPMAAAAEKVAEKVVAKAGALAGQAADTASSAASAVAGAATEAVAAAGAMAEKAADTVSDAANQASAAVAAATGGGTATPGKPGDEVYNTGCMACHATGAANAPKLTDKAAWEPRAAAGMATLVNSAVNGKGAMPPKGGLMHLTAADIENAVRYMLQQAGVDAGN